MEQRSYNTMPVGRSFDPLTKDDNANFWDRRTRIEQYLIIICAISVIVIISLIITVAVLANKKKQVAPENPATEPPVTLSPVEDVCSTVACKFAADQLKGSINDSINPCEDFYSYVCSGWKENNEIPETMSSISTFGILEENINNYLIKVLPSTSYEEEDVRSKTLNFYKSCIDNETREEKGLDGLKAVIQNLGGWPYLEDKLADDYDWTEALAYAIKYLGLSPILTIGVAPDAKNTRKNIIQFDQTSFGIGRQELIDRNETDNTTAKIVAAYKDLIKKSVHLLGTRKSENVLEAEIKEMVDFERDLAEYARSEEERRNPNSMYNKTSVANLNSSLSDVGEINVLSLLKLVFDNITEITEETEVIVNEFDYLYKTIQLIYRRNISMNTVANYIGWRFIELYGGATTQEFRDINLEFQKVATGVSESKPLNETCIGLTNDFFSLALGNVYINNEFDPETKLEIENMIYELKAAFNELLNANNWMDKETKEKAKYKLNEMVQMVAFPPFVNDTQELNDYYEKLGDVKNDTFLNNTLAVAKFSVNKELSKINKPHNRSEDVEIPVAIVNAFYDPSSNSINFPAGILNFPFYKVGLPPAINFGSIGTVIGHEMTHGFDDEGSQYDAEGNLKNWWSPEVREKFINKAKCFVEQYGSNIEPTTGMKLNGNNTLGENIADNGGVREAFKAYKSFVGKTGKEVRLEGLDLTPDQLFFVGYSYVWCGNERKEYLENIIKYNSHSPSRYRVQVTLSNTEEFAKTFKCPVNSTMNPEHRCLLW